MMSSNRGRSLWFLITCGLAFTPASSALGDWPSARHDMARTAQADGGADITRAVPYWRYYLGGSLGERAFAAVDVDADGSAEFVLIAGGMAVAQRRTGNVVWRSPPLALDVLIGITDLDGDGGLELVTRSFDRVHVLDLASGQVAWSEPVGEMGQIGGVRLGDVDGDLLADIVIQECGCCRVVSGNSGYVYSFSGNLSSPTRLWTLPTIPCGGQLSLTLVDSDGVEPLEVLFGEDRHFLLLDGGTGVELARSADMGTWMHRAECVPVQLDGTAGEELLCVHDVRFDPQINERSVFALRRVMSPAPALELMWSRPLAPVDGGQLAHAELACELDGSAPPEICVSAADGAGWTTLVLNGATGLPRGSIPNEVVQGVVSHAGGDVLLTAREGHLSGWQLQSTGLALRWTILDSSALLTADLSAAARSSIDRRVALTDIDDDGVTDLLTLGRQSRWEITVRGQLDSTPTTIASYSFAAGTEVTRVWPVATPDAADVILGVARNDGFLRLFGTGLTPARAGDDASIAELRTGGYYANGGFRQLPYVPSVASLDGSPVHSIVVPDSRRALLALDAREASFASPPRVTWEEMGGLAPVIVPGLDGGAPGVACLVVDQPESVPPTYSIKAIAADGSSLWRVGAPADPMNDLLYGRLNGDDVPDLVVQWGSPGDLLVHTRAISGVDGATIWQAAPTAAGAERQQAGAAIGRFDGDDLDDVYHQVAATQVLSGADGSVLASLAGPSYFMTTLVDVDDDQRSEVFLHGGSGRLRLITSDVTATQWLSPIADRPYPYGAVADCGAERLLFAGASLQYPSRMRLVDLKGATAFTERILVLAGGGAYGDEDQAQLATSSIGQLGSPVVHQGLTGSGQPSVLVGSTDGWLYAVNPCDATLQFAQRFDAAVGAAVFGDTDGDGRDEIVVSVGDGYVYGLRNFEIDAPSEAWETALDDVGGINVSDVVTTDRLAISWTDVPGATGYRLAVVDDNGAYVTSPPWQDVDAVTSTVLSGLALVDGSRYRVGVRARAGEAYSADTVSDGVVVHFPGGDGGTGPVDPPGGCCSGGGGADPLAGIVSLLFLRRRRRART